MPSSLWLDESENFASWSYYAASLYPSSYFILMYFSWSFQTILTQGQMATNCLWIILDWKIKRLLRIRRITFWKGLSFLKHILLDKKQMQVSQPAWRRRDPAPLTQNWTCLWRRRDLPREPRMWGVGLRCATCPRMGRKVVLTGWKLFGNPRLRALAGSQREPDENQEVFPPPRKCDWLLGLGHGDFCVVWFGLGPSLQTLGCPCRYLGNQLPRGVVTRTAGFGSREESLLQAPRGRKGSGRGWLGRPPLQLGRGPRCIGRAEPA